MIVRVLSGGSSFKGLAAYLTHDPNAQTTERVAWTHTLNCAHDHVPSAVDEMVWTYRDAELLKQEAGVRAGGRATEKPAKHISLNWAPDQTPDREQMIATTEQFLTHMKWQDHQAVLIAHQDKEYSHVHVILNMIHPETGLKLDEGFDQRRAQAWALEYEQSQGKIYCEQRLDDPADRQDAPTREAWMAFKDAEKQFAREDATMREQADIAEKNNSKNIYSEEWINLKNFQRQERELFFSEGKSAFSSLRQDIYNEVREEFRPRWHSFYQQQGAGGDADFLKKYKAELMAEQRQELKRRRDEACGFLRTDRNDIYRDLLDNQRDDRRELRERQAANLDNTSFFDDRRPAFDATRFADAANEVTRPTSASWLKDTTVEADADSAGSDSGDKHASSSSGGTALDLVMFLGNAIDRVMAADATPKPRATREERDLFRAAAEDTTRREEQEREAAKQKQRDREKARSWD